MSYIVEGVKLFAMLPMYPVAAGFKPALPAGGQAFTLLGGKDSPCHRAGTSPRFMFRHNRRVTTPADLGYFA